MERRWYKIGEIDEPGGNPTLAGAIKAICDALESEQLPRKSRYLECVARYEALGLVDTSAAAYNAAAYVDTERDLYNLTRSLIDTVHADIAARQRPKPAVLTTAGDWKTRRRAKKMDQFLEAQLQEDQGAYEDAWQVMGDVFTDAAMGGYGKGFAKVTADRNEKKVRVDRVLPYEILVDSEEAKYRDPRNLFHVYTMSRDVLLDIYGDDDDVAHAIESATRDDSVTINRGPLRVTDSVRVYEAWKLPFSDDKPGRHTICIQNRVLLDEEWTRKRFPFVAVTWAAERIGFWGRGLGDECRAQHYTVNEQAERLHERGKLCSHLRTFIPVGSKVDKKAMGDNDHEVFVDFAGAQPPVTVPVPPPTAPEYQQLEDDIRRTFDFTGVSQMNASSRKDPGVTAAVAMRTINDIQTVRFLPKARMYETAFAALGELMLEAVRELGNVVASWPGKTFLRQLKWSDVSLKEDMYKLHVAPSSQLSRDVGTRYQMAREMLEDGAIDMEAYQQLLGMPDIDNVLDQNTADRDYLEMVLDRYMDAETKEDLRAAGGYESPDPAYPDKVAAMRIVTQTYFEARRDGAPEYALSLLRRYLKELAAMVSAASAPPPTATPTGLGPPGMPPAGPMPPPTLQGVPPGMPIQ